MKQIIIQPGTKDARISYLRSVVLELDDKKSWTIEIKLTQSKRKLEQNRLSWLWWSYLAKWWYESTGEFKKPEVFKIYFQEHFLGYKETETLKGRVIPELIRQGP